MLFLAKIILTLSFFSSLTSCCYRMPDADEFSLVPSTNNPTFTKESAGKTPGVSY